MKVYIVVIYLLAFAQGLSNVQAQIHDHVTSESAKHPLIWATPNSTQIQKVDHVKWALDMNPKSFYSISLGKTESYSGSRQLARGRQSSPRLVTLVMLSFHYCHLIQREVSNLQEVFVMLLLA